MKRQLVVVGSLIVSVTATLLYAEVKKGAGEGKGAGDGVTVSSSGGVGCEAASKSPEIYSVYGDPKTVLEKFSNFNLDLPNRHMFVVFVEAEGKSEMRVFEKAGDGSMKVSAWQGQSATDLKAKLDQMILKNKGVNCVGEQSKAVLHKALGDTLKDDSKEAASPENSAAVLRHMLKDAGDFVGATFYLLC